MVSNIANPAPRVLGLEIKMNTLTQSINLKDEQINLAFANIGCDVEVSGEYGEPDRFTVTAESLADFEAAANNWYKCGASETGNGYIIFKDVAQRKGDQKYDLYIIDFGTARIACKF